MFKYEQTDASIYGVDFSSQFTISNLIIGQVKYSYLRGDDTKNDVPLIYMPPSSVFGSLTYRTLNPINLSSKITLDEFEIELNNRMVFEQIHILAEQDFIAPPAGYNLVGLKVSTNMLTPSYKVRLFVKADNLLNAQYRDYLNRQRYFADDVGISITMGINFKF